MSIRKKHKILKTIITSFGLVLISIPIITSSVSCSVFDPSTSPDIKPPPKPPEIINPILKVDWSNSITVKNAYFKALEKLNISYNNKFSSLESNNPNNFNKFEYYYPFNFGYSKTSNNVGLLQNLFNKWNLWYSTNDANYLSTGYVNIMSLLMDYPWLFYLGINYAALKFYDYCNQNQSNQDIADIFQYLPTPTKSNPYIDILVEVIKTNSTDKIFEKYYATVYRMYSNWYKLNENIFNSIEYYIDSIELSLNFIKLMMTSKIPKSFHEMLPGFENKTKTFYEFYLNTEQPKDEILKNEERIKNEMTNGYKLVNNSKYCFISIIN